MSKTVNQAKLTTCSCMRCGHEWATRKQGRPVACPNCTSRKWDEPAKPGGYRRGADHWTKRDVAKGKKRKATK